MISLLCMSVDHIHVWSLWRSEQGMRSPEIGVRGGSDPLRGCWESKPSPLHEHEQPVLLTAGLSLLIF